MRGIAVTMSLLRRHVDLIQDIITDFLSGPEIAIEYFIPVRFDLKFHFKDLRCFLTTNKDNIIDQHNDIDTNGNIC